MPSKYRRKFRMNHVPMVTYAVHMRVLVTNKVEDIARSMVSREIEQRELLQGWIRIPLNCERPATVDVQAMIEASPLLCLLADFVKFCYTCTRTSNFFVPLHPLSFFLYLIHAFGLPGIVQTLKHLRGRRNSSNLIGLQNGLQIWELLVQYRGT